MSKKAYNFFIWWVIWTLHGAYQKVLNIPQNIRWARHFTYYFRLLRSWMYGRIWLYSNAMILPFNQAHHTVTPSAISSGRIEFAYQIMFKIKCYGSFADVIRNYPFMMKFWVTKMTIRRKLAFKLLTTLQSCIRILQNMSKVLKKNTFVFIALNRLFFGLTFYSVIHHMEMNSVMNFNRSKAIKCIISVWVMMD